MRIISGGICAAQGFSAGSAIAGIKSKKQKKDITIIKSDTPAVTVGVFTTNVFKAAPVLISEQHIKNNFLQAIVVNSGNANACTGEKGLLDAMQMCQWTAEQLGIEKEAVAVASTGVIGERLPMDKIKSGIEIAAKKLSAQGNVDAAEAIMTTDTFMKERAVQIEIDDKIITLGGMAKGSGMIHPNMATTLAFVTTDVSITKEALQLALSNTTNETFNMITVDGDTSTNDMILLMANGQAQNKTIEQDTPQFLIFQKALHYLLAEFSKDIVRDGEGATKFLTVEITGARNVDEARIAARTICRSSLVKTAMFGGDANWGRVLCALGYSGIHFCPQKVDLFFNGVAVMKQGKAISCEQVLSEVFKQEKILITINLHDGFATATAWGCDLSYDYVRINGSYRS